jgi:hypothetical protein
MPMTDELAQIERDIADGRASAESLVQLFNAASDAEQQRDIDALSRACQIAKRLTETLGNGLAADAVRLLEHCNELLAHVQTATPAPPRGAGAATCPGCGRPLEGSPVRCRACGELLI